MERKFWVGLGVLLLIVLLLWWLYVAMLVNEDESLAMMHNMFLQEMNV